MAASPVTSVLAHVHGTGSTCRRGMSVPTSGVGTTILRVLGGRNFVGGIRRVRMRNRRMLHIMLGCNTGHRGIVGNLGEVSGPNLHMCTKRRRLPGILNKLNVTVVSASGNVGASGTTHGRNLNKRILTCI